MKIRLGTRKSPLALYQAERVRAEIEAKVPAVIVELVHIVTSGDKITDKNLYDIGGKGLFLKEIEEALLDGLVDIAVHSLKDVPGILPEGLEIAAVLERGDARDVLVSSKAKSIEELPQGAVIGTSSVRRRVLLKKMRPDLEFVMFRGNVPTRMDRALAGEVDATILAAAGLERLGLLDGVFCNPLDPMKFIPAAAQGTIGIEIRKDDSKMKELCQKINHEKTWYLSLAERSFLEYLDASCRTPISAYARYEYDRIKVDYMLSDFEGSDYKFHTEIGQIKDASQLGVFAAKKMGL